MIKTNITKQEFKEIMKELISLKRDEELLDEAFKKLDPDFNRLGFSRHETLITKILKITFDDQVDWIGYYLYECNYGENPLKVSYGDKKIKLKTIDQLWDILNTK